MLIFRFLVHMMMLTAGAIDDDTMAVMRDFRDVGLI